MTRVAAIDCGTNSLRLLVADVDPVEGTATDVSRRTTIVRLGQGVDKTGMFAAEALTRTFAVLRGFAAEMADLGAERVRMVATSAARDVANRDSFLAGSKELVGVEPEVISGDEEAALSFAGAAGALTGVAGIEAPIVVIDVGGGSTEFVTSRSRPVRGVDGSSRQGADESVVGRSLDIGSVRLTERHLHDDPPTADQVAAARVDAADAIGSLPPADFPVGTLVGVAGTVTTLAAMVLGLDRYDRDRIDKSRLTAADVQRAVATILTMTVAERRALPFMHPDRADVIGGGAVVLSEAARMLEVGALVVSEHDILDGIAWSIA